MTPTNVLPLRRRQLVSNGVMGMLIFVVTELMVFAGMISGFVIVKAGAVSWPPPGQPRLPFEETLLNTTALLASGVCLFFANRAFVRDFVSARRPLTATIVLGLFFVGFQGYEWVMLLGDGLTMTSSRLGAFFYLIVGTHALHAIAALCGLLYVFGKLLRGRLHRAQFQTAQVFWYFVVAVWPVLYLQVYL